MTLSLDDVFFHCSIQRRVIIKLYRISFYAEQKIYTAKSYSIRRMSNNKYIVTMCRQELCVVAGSTLMQES